jgi:hypothetical protein
MFLLCRREGPTQIPTFVLDIHEVLDRVSPSAAEILSRPIFSVRSPMSFGTPSFLSTQTRVLDMTASEVGLRLDLESLLDSTDKDGKAALSELFASIADAGTPARLNEGDILIIDNRRAAHARPAFGNRFNGQQRWLQRCLVRSEFWSCRSAIQAEGVRILLLPAGRTRLAGGTFPTRPIGVSDRGRPGGSHPGRAGLVRRPQGEVVG